MGVDVFDGCGVAGAGPDGGDFVESQHIRVAYGRDYGDVPVEDVQLSNNSAWLRGLLLKTW